MARLNDTVGLFEILEPAGPASGRHAFRCSEGEPQAGKDA
jgi:hypothetical protein